MSENDIEVKAEEVKYKEVRPYDDSAITAHAAKCGGERNVVEVAVYTDDLYKFMYLVKRPSKTVLQAIAEEKEKGDKKNDPTAITKIQTLMIGCVLEGDREAYEHDGAIYSQLVKEIGKLTQQARGDLKNS